MRGLAGHGRLWIGVVAVSALLVAGCDQTSVVLRAPASMLHEVDGISMLAEQPCDLQEPVCAQWLAAARSMLGIPASAKVTRLTHAETGYAYGGFSHPVVIVLDLEDGQRRAVAMICGGQDPQASRDVRPEACRQVSDR